MISKQKDPKFNAARRALIVWDRLHGHPLASLQKKYNISNKQIRKELKKADKEGLLKDIEQKILSSLSNKALELYDKALNDGDLFVAKDVLVHAAKIAERHDKKEQSREGMSLQLWLQLRKDNKLSEGDVIDVEPTNEALLTEGSDDGGSGSPFTETLAKRASEEAGPLRLEALKNELFQPGAVRRVTDYRKTGLKPLNIQGDVDGTTD